MAISGTHDFVMDALSREIHFRDHPRVLDIGAGKGALSARLRDAGLLVSACDVVPGQFDVSGIECKKCDGSGTLLFSNGQFDLALAVEVLEHIDGHDRFFSEAARILKPGGILVLTTPNILSLKSRLRFLLTGCYYSFGLLTPFTKDPIHQHISPFTLNRYAWMLSQHGLSVSRVTTDKMQNTSLLLSCLMPLVWLSALLRRRRDGSSQQQTSKVVLFGRKLLIVARKARQAPLSNSPSEVVRQPNN